jgi:hypothetical protein
MTCPLCHSATVSPFAEAHGRRFHRCPACGLVFVDPAQWPSAAEERAHYGTHENDPSDPGYRGFLSRLADPLAERLPAGAEGLDYGSGPGPTLSLMLAERGFAMRIFDPFFAPDPTALERRYDFITATEVAEHFFRPREEFDRLDGLLRPGGWLGVMTEVLREDRDFATWRYVRDPTHVCFYAPETIDWIARHYGWSAAWPHPNVVLFEKG